MYTLLSTSKTECSAHFCSHSTDRSTKLNCKIKKFINFAKIWFRFSYMFRNQVYRVVISLFCITHYLNSYMLLLIGYIEFQCYCLLNYCLMLIDYCRIRIVMIIVKREIIVIECVTGRLTVPCLFWLQIFLLSLCRITWDSTISHVWQVIIKRKHKVNEFTNEKQFKLTFQFLGRLSYHKMYSSWVSTIKCFASRAEYILYYGRNNIVFALDITLQRFYFFMQLKIMALIILKF